MWKEAVSVDIIRLPSWCFSVPLMQRLPSLAFSTEQAALHRHCSFAMVPLLELRNVCSSTFLGNPQSFCRDLTSRMLASGKKFPSQSTSSFSLASRVDAQPACLPGSRARLLLPGITVCSPKVFWHELPPSAAFLCL